MSEHSRTAWHWSPVDRAASAGPPRCGWPVRVPTWRSATPLGPKRPIRWSPRSAHWAARRSAVACNAARPDDVARLVAQTRERLGPIDLLAHCGAISNICDHSELSYERWLETIDVNLNGAFLVVFAVKDEMIARKFGRIVLISSVAALRPRKMQIHYASSKAGVIALTRCCGEAFAPHNVRVNCVAPGLIETEMAQVLSEESMKRIVADTPLGRIGQAPEIASVIRFLLSEESSFMTGETLSASGGRVTLP